MTNGPTSGPSCSSRGDEAHEEIRNLKSEIPNGNKPPHVGCYDEELRVACKACSLHRAAHLKKLGVNMAGWDYVVALPGNPNTGKSTVFNALTGLHQHTGNWPGKTVSRAEGGFAYAGKRYKLIDLPGTYSLLATSMDEEVARDFILFGQPDVTVVVVDATRLERNLNLVLQVLEITDCVVVCLNLMDEARRHGLQIDHRQLARDLCVPVVPTAARYAEGLPELLQAIRDVAIGNFVCRPHRLQNEPPALKQALTRLTAAIEAAFPGLANARWIGLRLLAGDERVSAAIRKGELMVLGSTGYQPVPSGDSPDGMERASDTDLSVASLGSSLSFRSAGRRPGPASRPRYPFSDRF